MNRYKIEILEIVGLLFLSLGIIIIIIFGSNIILKNIAIIFLLLGGIIYCYLPKCYRDKRFNSQYERIIYTLYTPKYIGNSERAIAGTILNFNEEEMNTMYYGIMLKYVEEEEVYEELIQDENYICLSRSQKYNILNKIFFNNKFLYDIVKSNSLEDEYLKKILKEISTLNSTKYDLKKLQSLKLEKYYEKNKMKKRKFDDK